MSNQWYAPPPPHTVVVVPSFGMQVFLMCQSHTLPTSPSQIGSIPISITGQYFYAGAQTRIEVGSRLCRMFLLHRPRVFECSHHSMIFFSFLFLIK
jgi:hypothetical protein